MFGGDATDKSSLVDCPLKRKNNQPQEGRLAGSLSFSRMSESKSVIYACFQPCKHNPAGIISGTLRPYHQI